MAEPTAAQKAESLATDRVDLRNLHEALMAEDAREVLRANRAATETQRRATLPGHASPAEDVLNFKSPTTVNHNYPAPPKPGMGTLAKLALAGVAATGLGLPIGGALALPAVLDALKPAAVGTDTDTDTVFEIGLGRPTPGEQP